MTGPVIETERLILRLPTLEDFPRWAEFQADPEATRFIGGSKTPAETWRILMTVAGAWSLTGESFFSVIDKADGRWLGRIGPWRPLDWPGPEIGWSLHPDAAGRGYALEAAVACMDHAFEALGWEEAIHTIHPDNRASVRLAERLGSYDQGPTRLPPPLEAMRVDRWGQTREEWRARRKG